MHELVHADVFDKDSVVQAMRGSAGAIVCAGSPKIEPKTIGLGTLELTGNNSIFGDYEEEAPIIIGGVAVVLVLAIVVVVVRRRRRSFDD